MKPILEIKSAFLIKRFNSKLDSIIGSDLPILNEIKNFVIESGGKRIRPLIHCYYARILGYEGEEWIDVGALGELIHAASLLHDDVVDSAEMRRGKPAVNRLYGNKSAVLAGDFLLSCCLDHLSRTSCSGELLKVFTRVLRMLSEGELLQMEWENNLDIPESVYERIILSKTAVLFGAMTESAAILVGRNKEEREIHRRFGERLGRIFQIRDDYLDYFGDGKRTSKEGFQDFRRGIVTRPVIVLRSSLNSREDEHLVRTWESEEIRISEEGLGIWMELAEKAELDQKLVLEIDAEIQSLRDYLKQFPDSEYSRKISNRLNELAVAL